LPSTALAALPAIMVALRLQIALDFAAQVP
jgi:hypothetical protein